jgi:glycosyltransferase involved in cell wall biosynthesis
MNDEQKIRVLHVINDFNGGGAQRLVIEISRYSSDRFEHYALCLSSVGEMSQAAESVFREVRYVDRSKNIETFLRGRKELSKFVKDYRINVVHSHLIQSDLISALTRTAKSVRKIRTLHTSSISKNESFVTRAIWFVMRYLRNRFHALVACTDAAMALAAETRQTSTMSLVISNGVPPRAPARKDSNNYYGYFLVLARFHPVKDFPCLLRAFSIAVESGVSSKLVCAGSGVNLKNDSLVKALNSDANLRDVDLRGFVDDVNPLLEGAKFLVISSSYGEALPMVGLEALANGVPVISTDVGDCGQLVAHAALLAQPGQPESLARSLIAADKLSVEEYKKLSEESLLISNSRFSLTKTVSGYEELYLEVTGADKN